MLNQTEALVAIDVNSGRATREHHIEDTALKTNVEAAEEIARQLRLRDLAGLIVIDFIDMDENRNNRTVERRLKEALKNDRARIQVGRISHFGLMEMSRQRIRSSVLESSTEKCAHCGGSGHVRSVSSVTLHLLRMLEEMLLKGATHNLIVRTRTEVALYVLNHKRAHLRDLETRFHISITVNADANVGAAQPFVIEKGEQMHSPEAAKALLAQAAVPADRRRRRGRGAGRGRRRGRSDRDRGDGRRGEAEAASESAEPREDDGQRRGRAAPAARTWRRDGREAHEGGAQEAAPAPVAAREGDSEGAEDGAHAEGQDGQHGQGEQSERNAAGAGADAVAGGATGAAARAKPNSATATARTARPRHDDERGVEPEVADAVADLGGPGRHRSPGSRAA